MQSLAQKESVAPTPSYEASLKSLQTLAQRIQDAKDFTSAEKVMRSEAMLFIENQKKFAVANSKNSAAEEVVLDWERQVLLMQSFLKQQELRDKSKCLKVFREIEYLSGPVPMPAKMPGDADLINAIAQLCQKAK